LRLNFFSEVIMNKIAIALVTFLAAQGHSYARGIGKGKGEFAHKMKEELNLNDEQLEKIREVRKSNRGQMKELRNEVKKAKTAFHDALANPQSSSSEIKSKHQAFLQAKNNMSNHMIDNMLAVRSQLDEKQIVRFNELKKNRMSQWKSKRSKRE
jgi:Spy/CpxP family protein refolding chaperone